MDGPHDGGSAQNQDEAQRFESLMARSWPQGQPEMEEPELEEPELEESASESDRATRKPPLAHSEPFMGHASFSFGRDRSDLPSLPSVNRAPCPLCGEPNRLRHAYCKRCNFRLPWAAAVEGLPELEPRLGRLDHAVGRALADTARVGCRFCNAPIQPYDRRCARCKRWLASARPQSGLDAWQPDFDAWNLSRVHGLKPSGCLSPAIFALALVLWRALA